MKLEVCATSYAVEIETERFLLMLEAETCWGGWLRPHDCLDAKLMELGAFKVEYNGHYQNYLYFTLATDDDTPELQAKVLETITSHLAGLQKPVDVGPDKQ